MIRLRFFTFAIATWLALAAGGAVLCLFTVVTTRAAEPLAFYVNYSAQVPTAPLLANSLSVVHPGARVDLAAAHQAGNTVLGYLSVGEVAADAAYRAEVDQQHLPYAGHNAVWNSDLVDLTDPRWAEYFVTKLAPAIVARGFDGFFLDTLDSVDLVAPRDAARTAALHAGLVNVVKRLRAAYPTQRILVNRGLFAFDDLRESIDGVLVESLFSTFDSEKKIYHPVAAADTDALLAELKRVTAGGRSVYVLDYADPRQPEAADAISDKIRGRGFHAFVSTPALDGTMLAPLRPVGRRICAFYGNLTTVQEDQVKWPAESFVAQKIQLPLEYLGYEVDYFKIMAAGDLPALDADYRAIVIPRFWEMPATVEPQVVDWLIAQRTAGRKIVIFGGLPFRDPAQRQRFTTAFGLSGNGAIVAPPLKLEVVSKDEKVLDFEASVPALPVSYLNIRAPADARHLLTVQARPKGGAPVLFDPVFTCSWGGMALDPYLLFRRADFREFWHVDPLAFLQLALGDYGAPAPDTTTRDGLRMFLNHIDGDGFSNFSQVEAGKRSAEIIRDRILKKYPLPVTASVIEGEVRAMIKTQKPEEAAGLEAIARDIFALPQVEIGSHTFSHPFFWIEGDRTEAFYDEQNLDLREPHAKLDLNREIEGSVNYINERLAPPGKPVKVILWSGNCRPPPAALAMARRLGIENLNGGDTIITERNKTLNSVAPRTMPWDDELQIFAPNQNENVYTNNWRGPLFGTFTHVLDTFAMTETPRRLKPINLYYHFYSGDYPASIQALETIYDWLMAQPLHAVAVSHYARIARDARNTTVYSAGAGRWAVVNRGESRTVRLPAQLASLLDLTRSPGVTGWNIAGNQAYVHSDGSPFVRLALAARPVENQPRLESSSGEFTLKERVPGRMIFSVADLRPVEVSLAGFAPGTSVRVALNGTSASGISSTDTEGRLRLNLPKQADVTVEYASPAAGRTP